MSSQGKGNEGINLLILVLIAVGLLVLVDVNNTHSEVEFAVGSLSTVTGSAIWFVKSRLQKRRRYNRARDTLSARRWR